MQNEETRLILVGGLPGTGKTLFGKMLAAEFQCCYLDKDTMTRPLVRALLDRIPDASGQHDRISEAYSKYVRPAEYDCMIDQALENLKNGVSVVASAHFYDEVQQPNWIEIMKTATESLGGNLRASLSLVWLTSVPELARTRLISRGEPRDKHMLQQWDDYVKANDYYFRPAFPHYHIRNEKEMFSREKVKEIAELIRRS